MVPFKFFMRQTVLRFTSLIASLTAVCFVAWVLVRYGKHSAEAEALVRRADARLRALKIAREIRNEIRSESRIDRQRRADRWMRER